MSGLKTLKKRIGATKGVRKTTKTMELISSVYLRKFQNQVRETKKFADELNSLKIVLDRTTSDSYIFEKDNLPKTLVLFSAFRGLNGNFDSMLRKKIYEYTNGKSYDSIIVFGKKASVWVKNIPANQIEQYEIKQSDQEKTPTLVLKKIARYLKRKIINEEIGQIDLVSIRIQGGNYFPQVSELLEKYSEKVESVEESKTDLNNFNIEFEVEFLNEYILENHLYAQLYLAYFESLCAENLARTFAMKQATKSATEMIDSLTLKYNKARQAKITQEVSEIISGTRKNIVLTTEKPKLIFNV